MSNADEQHVSCERKLEREWDLSAVLSSCQLGRVMLRYWKKKTQSAAYEMQVFQGGDSCVGKFNTTNLIKELQKHHRKEYGKCIQATSAKKKKEYRQPDTLIANQWVTSWVNHYKCTRWSADLPQQTKYSVFVQCTAVLESQPTQTDLPGGHCN